MNGTSMTAPIIVCALLHAPFALAIQQPDATAVPNPPTGGAKFPWPDIAATSPTTSPATSQNITGTVAVHILQGTLGGPAIAAIDFELELHHRGMLLDTIKSRTDEHGVALIENLPVAMQIQPVVRVEYAHLTYQVEGGLMDASHPHQKIEVACYEPTEQPPAWRVTMRHVMISEAQPPAQGLQVTEVVVIENPASHTWIGIPGRGGPNPKRITTAFDLPHGAHSVSLGQGFHDWCCSTLARDRLVNHLPLMPAGTQMMYSYLLPVADGGATIQLAAPALVDNMMVLVPDSMTTASVQGLAIGGTQAMGTTQVRSYVASNLHAGDVVSVQLAGLRTTSSAVAIAPAGAAGTQGLAKIIAAIGGGLILLAALVLLVLKTGRRTAAAH